MLPPGGDPGPPSVWQLPSVELARALFHESGDALLLVDPSSLRVLEVNPVATRLTGLAREGLIDVPVVDLVRQDTDEGDWLAVVRRTQSFHGRRGYQLRTGAQDWIPVSLSISRLHFSGSLPLALFVLRDLRELTEAVRQLQGALADLQRVLVSIQDCVWNAFGAAEGGWQYSYLSPVIERITGHPVDRFLAEPGSFADLVHPGDRAAHAQLLADVHRDGAASAEYRITRADGTQAWVQERIRVLRAPDSGARSLFGILADVTERKERERERHILQERLAQAAKMESTSLLAQGVAHDFNNLLTSILGYTELARAELGPASRARQMLGNVLDAGRRAAELTQQMLAFAGTQRLEPEPLEVAALVRGLESLLRGLAPGRVEVRADLPGGLPGVLANGQGLRQVILSLFLNAVEAIGAAPGVIAMTAGVEHLERPAYHFPLAAPDLPAGEYVYLEIRDTGCGIPAEDQLRVFDPFFTTRLLGRGLGLSAALGIIRGQRGLIHVQSEVGRGSAFRVYLPRAAAAPAAAEQAPASPPAPAALSATVLLIEDNEDLRRLVPRLLEEAGCRVIVPAGEAAAIEQVRRGGIDVILLDHPPPQPLGDRLLQEMARQQSAVPILLLTDVPNPEPGEPLAGRNVKALLRKPFGAEELRAGVRAALAGGA